PALWPSALRVEMRQSRCWVTRWRPGAILAVLITMFGPISGAHFNPAVSAAFALRKAMSARDLAIYVAAQCAGGLVGMFLAHAMFELPLIEVSPNIRTGTGIWLGEATATFRLILTIFLCLRSTPQAVPYMVALFITAGYWFTSSTSFANPAVTICAAGLVTGFSGIRPADIPWFILVNDGGCSSGSIVSLVDDKGGSLGFLCFAIFRNRDPFDREDDGDRGADAFL
ncbi:MAG: aquaporin, partial [Alphaproteobacteria bacterium]|nr:aquaporin [Alphaproteobacteria bacterium]